MVKLDANTLARKESILLANPEGSSNVQTMAIFGVGDKMCVIRGEAVEDGPSATLRATLQQRANVIAVEESKVETEVVESKEEDQGSSSSSSSSSSASPTSRAEGDNKNGDDKKKEQASSGESMVVRMEGGGGETDKGRAGSTERRKKE